MIADRAAAADAEFVDTRKAFKGHRVRASDEWINGSSYPVVESYHSDIEGRRKAYLPALLVATG